MLIAGAFVAIFAAIFVAISVIKADIRGKYLIFGTCCIVIVLGIIFIDASMDFVADTATSLINQIIA
jgi:hypothetical protein